MKALAVVWVLWTMPAGPALDEIVASGGKVGGPYDVAEFTTKAQCEAAARRLKDKRRDAWCKQS
jgi:hypothetical protein